MKFIEKLFKKKKKIKLSLSLRIKSYLCDYDSSRTYYHVEIFDYKAHKLLFDKVFASYDFRSSSDIVLDMVDSILDITSQQLELEGIIVKYEK